MASPSIPSNELTPQEDAFCQALVFDQLDFTDAIEAAGLSGCNNDTVLKRLLCRAEIQRKIDQYTRQYLSTVGVKIAATTVSTIAQNGQNENARLGAAKWLLENAGHGVASRIADREQTQSNRSLSEYSLAELEEVVRKGKETLDQLPRLKTLDINPSEPSTP